MGTLLTMNKEHEIQKYMPLQSVYLDLSVLTRTLVEKIASTHGIKIQNSDKRVKSTESLRNKMSSSDHKDKTSFTDFHDLAGCRIIFYLTVRDVMFSPYYSNEKYEPNLSSIVIEMMRERNVFPVEDYSEGYYSNFGYLLLAYLVEKVTGEVFHNEVSRRILEPLGMTSTGQFHRMFRFRNWRRVIISVMVYRRF